MKKQTGNIVLVTAIMFFLIPRISFSDSKPLLGERTITLKTRDGVRIIGSFFLPTGYLHGSKPSVPRLLFSEGIWGELEKDYLIISAPVKKGVVTKIPITSGDFTYTEENLYPLSEASI